MNKIKNCPTNFIRQIIEKDIAENKHYTVHTRFPPEPNGCLHIGHAKSICLNFGIAKDYQGQCNLRFDDTNPAKENDQFIKSIKSDVKWLGFEWSGDVRYSSNYFEDFYLYAIELIKKNLAYVDQLSTEEIRDYRGTPTIPGKNSPYRNRSIEKNLELFSKMRSGSFSEGSACLRAKIDMASNFMILRDPVIYRIKFTEHHQTGKNWCIYPMYDFAHCISDALEKITHSLCTLEFQDNRRLYDWILKNLSINFHPRQYEFSRLNLEYTVISKRKLSILVTRKIVEDWDDPRMPTISGLRRRGYSAAAIRKFCSLIGVTKQDSCVEMSLLESCIRDDLNQNAHRAMAVINPLKVIIENLPKSYKEIIIMPNHPNKPDMGTREVLFSSELWIDRADFRETANKQYKRLMIGKEVRLRNAYVIKAERVIKNKDGEITCIFCICDTNTLGKKPLDGRKIKGVIHWISAISAIKAEFRLYDRLFSVPNPSAAENFLKTINSNSLIISQGYVESSMQHALGYLSYQFEREGYFCIDTVHSSSSNLVFNRTVSLRNIWEK